MPNPSVTSLRNVSLWFGDLPVLDDISLDVYEGETKAVLGPSGAGKSSLLKIILGLLKPHSGSVWVNGQETTHLSERELIPIRREIGMVFQANALFDSLTVAENITFFLREKGRFDEQLLENVVREQLECCNLGDIGESLPEELSGGMKKRVAVARALAFGPKILLYDEPTTGLDPINAGMITELIKKLQTEKHVTSVVVTHVLRDAFAVADSVAMLCRGKIVFDGSVGELRSSDQVFIRDFLGEDILTSNSIARGKADNGAIQAQTDANQKGEEATAEAPCRAESFMSF
jgi:phospholipid/cholesterol/gamma-HCH transport system ATP-binding protein